VNSAILRCAVNGPDDCRAVFNAFDIDDSGTVEEDEYLVGFCIYTDTSPSASAKFLFHAMDADNSGSIEKPELVEHMRTLVHMLHILFPKIMEFQLIHGNEVRCST